MTDAVAARCAALVAALPETLRTSDGELPRREVRATGVAAWGDPAVTLACGVPSASEDVAGEVFGFGPPGGRQVSFLLDDLGAARTYTTTDLPIGVRVAVPDAHDAPFLATLVPLLTAELG